MRKFMGGINLLFVLVGNLLRDRMHLQDIDNGNLFIFDVADY